MKYDEMWVGGPKIHAAADAFKLCTDSVLLADFTNVTHAKKIFDLGCGAGVLTILLAVKSKDARVDAIEILPAAADACRENLSLNGLDAVVTTGDLREHRTLFEAGAYDLVVSNPPYFPEHSGRSAPDFGRAIARDERSCTLADVCAAAAYLCRWGGLFALVHRPERLSEVFCTMNSVGIEAKRLRFVQHSRVSTPNLILIEGRRGGKSGLVIEPPLILADEDGTDSDEICRIYRREKP